MVFMPWSRIFTHTKTSSLLVKGWNIDLYSALMAIEYWGFFNVPHLLWHKISVYNDHLRRTVTLTPICRAFGSGACTAWYDDLGMSRTGIESRTTACQANALQTEPTRWSKVSWYMYVYYTSPLGIRALNESSAQLAYRYNICMRPQNPRTRVTAGVAW